MRKTAVKVINLPTKLAIALACVLAAVSASGAELLVRVGGIAAANGQIGCALFKGPEGFPMDNGPATQLWLPAEPQGVQCRFEQLPAGRYAVAVSHDLNGNRKVDSNLFGIPIEAWGVSNNIRPALRAPRFEEAAFVLAADQILTIDVRVAK